MTQSRSRVKNNGNNMSDSELSDQQELDVSEGATANIVSQSQPAESINQSRISFALSVRKDYQFPSSLQSTKTKEGEAKAIKSSSSLILSYAAKKHKDKAPVKYEDFTRPQAKKKRSPQSFERLSKKSPPVPKQEDLSHCTFQPSINRSTRLTRNSQEYYQDMVKFEEFKQQRIHQARSSLEAQQQVFEFKPNICDKSNKILELSSYISYPSHVRLFKSPSCNTSKFLAQDPNDSFTPSVNSRSKYLIRDRNVSDILYEDAVRRTNKSYETTSESYVATNGVSNRIIKSHFESEFDKVCSSHNLYEDDKVNYSKYRMILEALHLISGQEPNLGIKLWDELTQGGQKLRIRKLRRALRVILQYQTKSDSDKLMQKVFVKMYEHRVSSLLLEKPKEIPSSENAPKPQKRRVENHLFKKGKEIPDRLQHLIDLSKEREMDECTFVPSLNHSKFKHKIDKERKGQNTFEHLFSLSKTIRARKDLKVALREQSKLEEDQAKCTFSPEISRCKLSNVRETYLTGKQDQDSTQKSKEQLNQRSGKKSAQKRITKSKSYLKWNLEQNQKKLDKKSLLKTRNSTNQGRFIRKQDCPRRKTTETGRNHGNTEIDISEPLWDLSSLNASEAIFNQSVIDFSVHLGNLNHSKLHLNPEAIPEEPVEDFSPTHGLSADKHRQLLA